MSISKPLRFITSDAVEIVASAYGENTNQTILLLHGAGQTRYSWESTALTLAGCGYHAITVDTRGHGDSSWSESGDYSIDTLISDLHLIIATLTKKGLAPPVVIGASLGGITALLAQGESPQLLFKALVLVDITPRIDPRGVARILSFMTEFSTGFQTVEQASVAVAAYQPHRKQANAKGNSGLLKNLRLAADGRYYWHWDPRLMRHVSHFDQQIVDRQNSAAANLRLPVLLVHGKLSEIVSRESAEEFLQLVPHAHYIDVADAAHMVASDDNDVFANAVLEFLTEWIE